MPKPEVVLTEEHKTFLNDLRESGVTNMLGAAPYIRAHFSVTMQEAREILSAWIDTFSE